MLTLHEHNVRSADYHPLAYLDEALDVTVVEEINGDRMLSFSYPVGSDKYRLIAVNCVVFCENQAYRIVKQSEDCDRGRATFECEHVFNFTAKREHIQTIGGTKSTIGASPFDIMKEAFAKSRCSVISKERLETLGMKWLGSDGLKIDLDVMDKTTPYDVMNRIIESCGKGEVYVDGYNVALVERIGADNGVRLAAYKNMQEINIDRDMSGVVTRLYPYGKNDLDISEAQKNINKYMYIESPLRGSYGTYDGYMDFDEFTSPDDLFERALWEFDEENEDRIDLPSLNISGNMIDTRRLNGGDFSLHLGDTVIVSDMGNEYKRRVIKLEYRPYEASVISLSVGNVKRDMFFYLKQLGMIAKRYKGVYTNNGKIKGSCVSGTVESAQLSESTEGYASLSGAMNLGGDMLSVIADDGSVCEIGTVGGSVVFEVSTPLGSIGEDDNGMLEFDGSINAQKMKVNGFAVSTDTEGNLYFNGKKVKFEEVENGVEA